MFNFKYKIAKFKSKRGNREALYDYFREKGYKIGKNCNICSRLSENEGYLVEIGDNTVISYNVNFITHDASYGAIIKRKYIDLYGKIIIGNNCFIGAGSILLYGVKLGDNTIVAAGSVVTKSFKEGNVVIGGNPAKVICDTKTFIDKYEKNLIDTLNLNSNQKKERVLNSSKLIER